jgi:hypothetical protein
MGAMGKTWETMMDQPGERGKYSTDVNDVFTNVEDVREEELCAVRQIGRVGGVESTA